MGFGVSVAGCRRQFVASILQQRHHAYKTSCQTQSSEYYIIIHYEFTGYSAGNLVQLITPQMLFKLRNSK